MIEREDIVLGALDRLQTYSAKEGIKPREGFTKVGINTDLSAENNANINSNSLGENPFNGLDAKEQAYFNKVQPIYKLYKENEQGEIEFTELYNVLKAQDNVRINAIAGSGKTTAMTLKLIHDMETGEIMTLKQIPNGADILVPNKVWVSTFLRTGASELETAMVKMCNRLGISEPISQITFSTLDAEFKRALNAMGVATNIGDVKELKGLLKKSIDVCNITKTDGSSLSREDYDIIGGIVNYSRGRLDDKKYFHPNCEDYSLTPTILQMVINQYANYRSSKGIMDFEEIMELLYKYLYDTPNPAVQNFIADRYNYIYIDEVQDISQMNYAILKFYTRGKLLINRDSTIVGSEDPLYTGEQTLGKLVVVGDVSQSIYGFRGADANILGYEIDKDYAPTVCNLSCNWRCPDNILNPIVSSIHINDTSKNQDIYASKSGGEFYPYVFTNFLHMASNLLSDVEKDVEDNMSIAILCRTNYDGLIPAFILELSNDNFNFRISGSNMTLNSGLPRNIFSIVSLFTEKNTPSVQTALETLGGFYSRYEVKKLMQFLKLNNKSVWTVDEEDLEYSCPNLSTTILKLKKVLYKDGKRTSETEMETLKMVLSYLITVVFNKNTTYANNGRVFAQILLIMLESREYKEVIDFIEDYEFVKDKIEGRMKKSSAPIQIATVHEFKGKESDSVIVWNDSVDVFPSKKCNLSDKEQVEEERRVHYIACTRAKKRERIYSIAGQMGMFAKEMNCKFVNPVKPSVSLK